MQSRMLPHTCSGGIVQIDRGNTRKPKGLVSVATCWLGHPLTKGKLWQCVLAPLVLFLGGCAKIHYRNYGFEWIQAKTTHSTTVDVVASGLWQQEDSAGYMIERRASPYVVAVYFDAPSSDVVQAVNLHLIGKQSGTTIKPRLSAPEPREDKRRGGVATAFNVVLPYDDYRVELRIKTGIGQDTAAEYFTGTLKMKLEHRAAFRFWEKLMST